MTNNSFKHFFPYIKWGVINFIILYIYIVSTGSAGVSTEENIEAREFAQVLTAVNNNWSAMMYTSSDYDKVSGKNYRSSTIAYNALNNAIPVYKQALHEIQSVNYKSESVIRFQNSVTRWVNNRLSIYTNLAYLYKQSRVDVSGLSEQILELNESDNQKDKIFKEYLRLKERYGILDNTETKRNIVSKENSPQNTLSESRQSFIKRKTGIKKREGAYELPAGMYIEIINASGDKEAGRKAVYMLEKHGLEVVHCDNGENEIIDKTEIVIHINDYVRARNNNNELNDFINKLKTLPLAYNDVLIKQKDIGSRGTYGKIMATTEIRIGRDRKPY